MPENYVSAHMNPQTGKMEYKPRTRENRMCKQCKEWDFVNRDGLCNDCEHLAKLQNFADNVAELVVSSDYDNRLMLQVIIESARLLRKA